MSEIAELSAFIALLILVANVVCQVVDKLLS